MIQEIHSRKEVTFKSKISKPNQTETCTWSRNPIWEFSLDGEGFTRKKFLCKFSQHSKSFYPKEVFFVQIFPTQQVVPSLGSGVRVSSTARTRYSFDASPSQTDIFSQCSVGWRWRSQTKYTLSITFRVNTAFLTSNSGIDWIRELNEQSHKRIESDANTNVRVNVSKEEVGERVVVINGHVRNRTPL